MHELGVAPCTSWPHATHLYLRWVRASSRYAKTLQYRRTPYTVSLSMDRGHAVRELRLQLRKEAHHAAQTVLGVNTELAQQSNDLGVVALPGNGQHRVAVVVLQV